MTQSEINYHDRLFRAVKTDGGGDVGSDTLFRYEQIGTRLTATYSGGDVEFGTMVGTVADDGALTFLYQHRSRNGELRAGRCESRPEILPNGKIRLHERWVWTYGPNQGVTGKSIVEEV